MIIVFSTIKIVKAQSVSTLMGARAAGISYTSSVLKDEWSLFNNVGGLAGIEKINTSFAVDLHPTLLGANRMAATFSAPIKLGVVGVGFFRFGDNLYSEQMISTGYGNQFGIASLGLKVNYIQYRSEAYGTKSAVTINFGGVADITPQLSVGAYITNINQPKLSAQGERLPTKLVAGLGFKPVEKLLLVTEIEKDLDYEAMWKGGAEYVIHKKIFIRTGFNVHPNASFFGIGFQTWKLKIDYALQYSNALNFAHHASAIYFIQPAKKDEN
ncbi:MAG TPA: hypothetical protein VFE57_07415 [Cyclobacteriaceae bacterium]|nr:hypothetical protein [Cyclobacteriaceae bacterium]